MAHTEHERREYKDGLYGPHRCTCSRTTRCPACIDFARPRLHPDGLPLLMPREDEPADDARTEDARLMVLCGVCEREFPLRPSQKGSLMRGQTVFCSDRCRLNRKQESDCRRRHRKRQAGKTKA
jgi:hypothetical protein